MQVKGKFNTKRKRIYLQRIREQMRKQSSINSHKRALHEGIKFSCGQCQHEATTVGSLDQHKRLVHEVIKYPCRQCQYQATSKGDLTKHERAVH